MKATELKRGVTKVRWFDHWADRRYMHGVFMAFGYSVRKAWVKRKCDGERRFVNTRSLRPARAT